MKRKTIRSHKDFFMASGRLKATASGFVLKAKKTNKPGDPRYGLVVSKRAFRLAVQRNRAKRLMRDWVAFNECFMLPELDYIFILQEPILEYNRESGRKDVARTLIRIARLYKRHE